MVERERGPDMGPHTFSGGGPDAADDTEEELHRLSVYETDPPHDKSVEPERKNRIVVQILRARTQLPAGIATSALSYTRRNWALKSKYHTRQTFSRRSFMS